MEENTEKASVLHNFQQEKPMNTLSSKFLLIILVVIGVFGIGTGYLLARASGNSTPTITTNTSGSTAKGAIEGSDDLKTFKDPAEGTLKEGGVEGEGQYHLVRPGGESQNVYMTSALVDLSKYVGKKVKVWGQTQKAQKVGWLMDVGRVEVLD